MMKFVTVKSLIGSRPKLWLLLLFSACVLYLIQTQQPAPSNIIASASEESYQVTERQEFPDYVQLDVMVAENTSKNQLSHYAEMIMKSEKSKPSNKTMKIWFYNGDSTLGRFDSKSRSRIKIDAE